MKKLVSLVTVLCFLFSNFSYALDMRSTNVSSGGINLAPQLVLGDLGESAPHHKKMMLAEMKLRMSLAAINELCDGTLENADSQQGIRAALEKAKYLEQIDQTEDTVFDPAEIKLFFNQVQHVGKHIFVIPAAVRKHGKPNNYMFYFSTVRGVDGYPVVGCETLEEFTYYDARIKALAAADRLPERNATDNAAMERYRENNELAIDAFVRERMEAGDFAEIEGRTKKLGWDEAYPDRKRPETYVSAEYLEHLGTELDEFLGQFGTDLTTALNGKNLVFIRVPETTKPHYPVIYEKDSSSGEMRVIDVMGHTSNTTVYIFLPGDKFDRLKKGERTDSVLNLFVEPKLVHEIGVIYGLPFYVDNQMIRNDLDFAYGEAPLRGTPDAIKDAVARGPVDLDQVKTRDYAFGQNAAYFRAGSDRHKRMALVQMKLEDVLMFLHTYRDDKGVFEDTDDMKAMKSLIEEKIGAIQQETDGTFWIAAKRGEQEPDVLCSREDTVYHPARMSIYIENIARVGEHIFSVPVSMIMNNAETQYRLLFSTTRESGQQQFSIVPLEAEAYTAELTGHIETSGELPEMADVDREAMKRYIEHERKIDAWIARKIKAGESIEINPGTGIKMMESTEAFIGEVLKHNVALKRHLWTGSLFDRVAGMNIVLIKAGVNDRPVFADGGSSVRDFIHVDSHASNNTLYFFVDEATFRDFGVIQRQEPLGWERVSALFGYHIAPLFAHELGVLCGFPYTIHNERPYNYFDRAYDEVLDVYDRYNSQAAVAFQEARKLESVQIVRRMTDAVNLDTNLESRDYAGGKKLSPVDMAIKIMQERTGKADVSMLHPLMGPKKDEVGIYRDSIRTIHRKTGAFAFVGYNGDEEYVYIVHDKARDPEKVKTLIEGFVSMYVTCVERKDVDVVVFDPTMYRTAVLQNPESNIGDIGRRMAALRYKTGRSAAALAITPATEDSAYVFLKKAQEEGVPVAFIFSEPQIGVADQPGYFGWDKKRATWITDTLVSRMGVTVPVTIERDHGKIADDVESTLTNWNSLLLDYTGLNGDADVDQVTEPQDIYALYKTNILQLADKIQEAEAIQKRMGVEKGLEIGITEVGKKPTPPAHTFYFLYFLYKELEKRRVKLRPTLAEAQIGTIHGYGAENLAREDLLRDVAAMMGIFHLGEAAHGTSGTTKQTLGLYPELGVAHAHIFTDFIVAEFRAILEHNPELFIRYTEEALKFPKTAGAFKKVRAKYGKYNDKKLVVKLNSYKNFIKSGKAAKAVTQLLADLDTLTPEAADKRRFADSNTAIVWFILQRGRYLLDKPWSLTQRIEMRKNASFVATMEKYVGEEFDKFSTLFDNVGIAAEMASVTKQDLKPVQPVTVRGKSASELIEIRVEELIDLAGSENVVVAGRARADLEALIAIPFIQAMTDQHVLGWAQDVVEAAKPSRGLIDRYDAYTRQMYDTDTIQSAIVRTVIEAYLTEQKGKLTRPGIAKCKSELIKHLADADTDTAPIQGAIAQLEQANLIGFGNEGSVVEGLVQMIGLASKNRLAEAQSVKLVTRGPSREILMSRYKSMVRLPIGDDDIAGFVVTAYEAIETMGEKKAKDDGVVATYFAKFLCILRTTPPETARSAMRTLLAVNMIGEGEESPVNTMWNMLDYTAKKEDPALALVHSEEWQTWRPDGKKAQRNAKPQNVLNAITGEFAAEELDVLITAYQTEDLSKLSDENIEPQLYLLLRRLKVILDALEVSNKLPQKFQRKKLGDISTLQAAKRLNTLTAKRENAEGEISVTLRSLRHTDLKPAALLKETILEVLEKNKTRFVSKKKDGTWHISRFWLTFLNGEWITAKSQGRNYYDRQTIDFAHATQSKKGTIIVPCSVMTAMEWDAAAAPHEYDAVIRLTETGALDVTVIPRGARDINRLAPKNSITAYEYDPEDKRLIDAYLEHERKIDSTIKEAYDRGRVAEVKARTLQFAPAGSTEPGEPEMFEFLRALFPKLPDEEIAKFLPEAYCFVNVGDRDNLPRLAVRAQDESVETVLVRTHLGARDKVYILLDTREFNMLLATGMGDVTYRNDAVAKELQERINSWIMHDVVGARLGLPIQHFVDGRSINEVDVTYGAWKAGEKKREAVDLESFPHLKAMSGATSFQELAIDLNNLRGKNAAGEAYERDYVMGEVTPDRWTIRKRFNFGRDDLRRLAQDRRTDTAKLARRELVRRRKKGRSPEDALRVILNSPTLQAAIDSRKNFTRAEYRIGYREAAPILQFPAKMPAEQTIREDLQGLVNQGLFTTFSGERGTVHYGITSTGEERYRNETVRNANVTAVMELDAGSPLLEVRQALRSSGIVDVTNLLSPEVSTSPNVTEVYRTIIPKLAYLAANARSERVRDYVQKLILKTSEQMGARLSSIQDLYHLKGSLEKKLSGKKFTVPAMNLRCAVYDEARLAFEKALELKVGAFVIEIAPTEVVYTGHNLQEWASLVTAGAMAAGYEGPVFLKLDHMRTDAKKYAENKDKEIQRVFDIIKAAVDAGFYAIDIDTSTLEKDPKVETNPVEQQRENFVASARLIEMVRAYAREKGIKLALGVEVGEVGEAYITEEHIRAFLGNLQQLLQARSVEVQWDIEMPEVLAIPTGTPHGGLRDKATGEARKDVKIAFPLLETADKICKEFGMCGVVQHGASKLPMELFNKFPEAGAAEIHLATAMSDIEIDTILPQAVRKAMLDAWVVTEAARKAKAQEGLSDKALRKNSGRRKLIGQHKQAFWDVSSFKQTRRESLIGNLMGTWYKLLGVENTRDKVRELYPAGLRTATTEQADEFETLASQYGDLINARIEWLAPLYSDQAMRIATFIANTYLLEASGALETERAAHDNKGENLNRIREEFLQVIEGADEKVEQEVYAILGVLHLEFVGQVDMVSRLRNVLHTLVFGGHAQYVMPSLTITSHEEKSDSRRDALRSLRQRYADLSEEMLRTFVRVQKPGDFAIQWHMLSNKSAELAMIMFNAYLADIRGELNPAKDEGRKKAEAIKGRLLQALETAGATEAYHASQMVLEADSMLYIARCPLVDTLYNMMVAKSHFEDPASHLLHRDADQPFDQASTAMGRRRHKAVINALTVEFSPDELNDLISIMENPNYRRHDSGIVWLAKRAMPLMKPGYRVDAAKVRDAYEFSLLVRYQVVVRDFYIEISTSDLLPKEKSVGGLATLRAAHALKTKAAEVKPFWNHSWGEKITLPLLPDAELKRVALLEEDVRDVIERNGSWLQVIAARHLHALESPVREWHGTEVDRIFFDSAKRIQANTYSIPCEQSTPGGHDVRHYTAILTVDGNGKFMSVTVCTEEEAEAMNALRRIDSRISFERHAQDKDEIKHYLEHERNVDSVIEYAFENNLAATPLKGRFNYEATVRLLLEKLNIQVETPAGLKPIALREFHVIKKTPEIESMMKTVSVRPDDGGEHRIPYKSHSSNKGVYVFVSPKLFDEMLAIPTESAKPSADSASSIEHWVAYEIGSMLGLPMHVDHSNEISKRYSAFKYGGQSTFEPLKAKVVDLDNIRKRDYVMAESEGQAGQTFTHNGFKVTFEFKYVQPAPRSAEWVQEKLAAFIDRNRNTLASLNSHMPYKLDPNEPDMIVTSPVAGSYGKPLALEFGIYSKVADSVTYANGTIEAVPEDARTQAASMTTEEFLASYSACGLVSPSKMSSVEIEAIMQAVSEAGCPRIGIEIAFRYKAGERHKVLELIKRASEIYASGIVAAGTVLSGQDAIDAAENGATLIVTPGLTLTKHEVKQLHDKGCRVVMGVGSAQEAIVARKRGADAIKAFPYNPKDNYLGAVKGPLPAEMHEALGNYVEIVEGDRYAPATFTNLYTFLSKSPARKKKFSLPLAKGELVRSIQSNVPDRPVLITGGVSVDMVKAGLLYDMGVGAALSVKSPEMIQGLRDALMLHEEPVKAVGNIIHYGLIDFLWRLAATSPLGVDAFSEGGKEWDVFQLAKQTLGFNKEGQAGNVYALDALVKTPRIKRAILDRIVRLRPRMIESERIAERNALVMKYHAVRDTVYARYRDRYPLAHKIASLFVRSAVDEVMGGLTQEIAGKRKEELVQFLQGSSLSAEQIPVLEKILETLQAKVDDAETYRGCPVRSVEIPVRAAFLRAGYKPGEQIERLEFMLGKVPQLPMEEEMVAIRTVLLEAGHKVDEQSRILDTILERDSVSTGMSPGNISIRAAFLRTGHKCQEQIEKLDAIVTQGSPMKEEEIAVRAALLEAGHKTDEQVVGLLKIAESSDQHQPTRSLEVPIRRALLAAGYEPGTQRARLNLMLGKCPQLPVESEEIALRTALLEAEGVQIEKAKEMLYELAVDFRNTEGSIVNGLLTVLERTQAGESLADIAVTTEEQSVESLKDKLEVASDESLKAAREAVRLIPAEYNVGGFSTRTLARAVKGLLTLGRLPQFNDKSALVFSEHTTFDHGLGVLLPKLAQSGTRVAVIAKTDKQRKLIETLNKELPGRNQIVCVENLTEATAVVKASRYYYFKVKEDSADSMEENAAVTVYDITNVVKQILEAIGKANNVVDTLLPRLHDAARRFAEAA